LGQADAVILEEAVVERGYERKKGKESINYKKRSDKEVSPPRIADTLPFSPRHRFGHS
jgi:hypothetical protein